MTKRIAHVLVGRSSLRQLRRCLRAQIVQVQVFDVCCGTRRVPPRAEATAGDRLAKLVAEDVPVRRQFLTVRPDTTTFQDAAQCRHDWDASFLAVSGLVREDAVAALKPDAEKLNAQAEELDAAIDNTTATANRNISRLSAE